MSDTCQPITKCLSRSSRHLISIIKTSLWLISGVEGVEGEGNLHPPLSTVSLFGRLFVQPDTNDLTSAPGTRPRAQRPRRGRLISHASLILLFWPRIGLCTLLTPSRTSSPLERDVLYGRPLTVKLIKYATYCRYRKSSWPAYIRLVVIEAPMMLAFLAF